MAGDDRPYSQKRYRSRSGSRTRSPPRKRPDSFRQNGTNNTNRRPDPRDGGNNRRRSRSKERTPPRKRPGAGSRITNAEREAARKRQEERDRELVHQAHAEAAARGVHDVVKQHYNAVPERGRDWRRTDSKIKGLRSFNNWIKSCIIQKFSPGLDSSVGSARDGEPLRVLDVGCGKGGDLQKWQAAPRPLELYIGLDPADVSITQARERYQKMKTGRGPRGRPQKLFHAEFHVKDCFGEWLGDIPIIRDVGIDPNVGPGAAGMSQRWGGGGFDVVSMMFCMHYAFESEQKARGMLRNVAGALKKGGRFLGVIPNSDIISAQVEKYHQEHSNEDGNAAQDDDDDDWDPEKSLDTEEPKKAANGDQEDGEVEEEGLEWGNSIYRVKFPGKTPKDGIFRPPYGWKYFYFLEEAVEEVPEYVVPWEAFRAIAEDYNLELQYRKPFNEMWDEEKDGREMKMLSERMGVRDRETGKLLVNDEELNAASFYHAFCFYKV